MVQGLGVLEVLSVYINIKPAGHRDQSLQRPGFALTVHTYSYNMVMINR